MLCVRDLPAGWLCCLHEVACKSLLHLRLHIYTLCDDRSATRQVEMSGLTFIACIQHTKRIHYIAL